jgi:hypothetical protein
MWLMVLKNKKGGRSLFIFSFFSDHHKIYSPPEKSQREAKKLQRSNNKPRGPTTQKKKKPGRKLTNNQKWKEASPKNPPTPANKG